MELKTELYGINWVRKGRGCLGMLVAVFIMGEGMTYLWHRSCRQARGSSILKASMPRQLLSLVFWGKTCLGCGNAYLPSANLTEDPKLAAEHTTEYSAPNALNCWYNNIPTQSSV